MKGFGGLLVLLAIGSAVLPMMGRQFTLVSWIDNWGSTVGWIIRGLMIIVGIGLFVADSRSGGEDAADS